MRLRPLPCWSPRAYRQRISVGVVGLGCEGADYRPVPSGEAYVRKIMLVHPAIPARPGAALLLGQVLQEHEADV